MSAFKDGVYWREQCDYCSFFNDGIGCKYQRSTRLAIKRLEIAEADSDGCYGTWSFWCDYFKADEELVKANQMSEVDA